MKVKTQLIKVNELVEVCDVRENGLAISDVWLPVVEDGVVVHRCIREIEEVTASLAVTTDDNRVHYLTHPYDFVQVLVKE